MSVLNSAGSNSRPIDCESSSGRTPWSRANQTAGLFWADEGVPVADPTGNLGGDAPGERSAADRVSDSSAARTRPIALDASASVNPSQPHC